MRVPSNTDGACMYGMTLIKFAGCPLSTRIMLLVKGKGMAFGFQATPMVRVRLALGRERYLLMFLFVWAGLVWGGNACLSYSTKSQIAVLHLPMSEN